MRCGARRGPRPVADQAPAIRLGEKPAGYYGQGRADVIAELEPPLGRVLDVGCGEGGAADALRAAGASWISGIEIMPEPAARAAERYDEVRSGDALEVLDEVTGPFDTILCYDVLEHVVDPALVRANEVMEVRGSAAKLHAATGWAPEMPLERTLADSLAWWRAHPG